MRKWWRCRARVLVVAVVGACLSVGATGGGAHAAGGSAFVQIITLSGADGSPEACQLAQVTLDGPGAVTPIGPTFTLATDGCPFDVALRGHELFAVLSFGTDASAPSTLVTIDTATGARTTIGNLGFATNLQGLAFDGGGRLLMYGQTTACDGGTGASCLYELDPATGAATLVAVGAEGAQMLGATASCTEVLGNQFIQPDDGPPSSRLVSLDTTTGTFTQTPEIYGDPFIMTGIDRDEDGVLHGVGFGFTETGPAAPTAYVIDEVTGTATLVGDVGLEPGQVLAGLAITSLDCSSPPAPAPVIAEVTFTG